ncbi:MAG: PAS-domain containing protein [Proteobacteria bacterium]|nr:PAS-domain containing protein [Pseudomonadota bacterium]
MKGNAGTIRRLNSADRRWFENFARVSGGWFWETDAEGRFVYMSDSVEEVTGIRPEWHYGKTRQDIGAPEAVSQAAWDAHLEQLRQHQPFDDFIFLRPGPDGGRWMKTSGMPVFGSDGAFQGYQGLAADITAQVSAEREAGLLADAIEQFSESFALWDADERLVICNGKFRDLNRAILDYTVPGTLFVDFLKAANRAGLVARAGALNSDNMTIEEWTEARLEKFRNPGQPFEMQRQNGTWLWVVEQRMADGAMVSSATDITQVKLAKQEQEAAHRRLQDAIEVLPGAFVLFDEDDTILVTNSIYTMVTPEPEIPGVR